MRIRPASDWLGPSMAIALAAALFLTLVSRASAGEPTSHTVAWGETLYSIARAYGVSPQSLSAVNGLRLNSWVYAGQQLVIPANGTTSTQSSETPSGYYTVNAGDTLYSVAARFGTTVDKLSASNDLPANGLIYVGWTLHVPVSGATLGKPSTQSYIVQNGEQLALIAMRFGTTAQAVALANSLPNAWLVYAGQRLILPTSRAELPQTPAVAANALQVANIPIYRQKQTLTCEEASAAMATSGAVSEAQLLSVLPHGENPFEGIRGRTNSPYFGGLSDYGIYAQGLEKGLTALGVRSQLLYGQSYDDFKAALLSSLRVGHPVIWWHTWQDTYQSPVSIRLSSGSVVKLVPYEHAGVIVAANDKGITYNDPYDATVRFVSWADHRRVSAYFDNMALVILQRGQP